jgi:hypothetical protein
MGLSHNRHVNLANSACSLVMQGNSAVSNLAVSPPSPPQRTPGAWWPPRCTCDGQFALCAQVCSTCNGFGPPTGATLALEAGIHPKVVSERLGHANVSITLDTYSHVSQVLQSEVADVLAAIVFPDGR